MAIPGYRLDLWFGMRRLDRSKLKILSGEVRALTCVNLRAAEPQWVKPTPAITRRVVCATREIGQCGADPPHHRGAQRPAKGKLRRHAAPSGAAASPGPWAARAVAMNQRALPQCSR